jgi:uncharacterized coiled-coil protein SlyX
MPRRTQAPERRAAYRQAKAAAAAAPKALAIADKKQAAEMKQLGTKLALTEKKNTELGEKLQQSVSVSDRVQMDLISMTLGQSFNETLNFFIRWAAEASQQEKGDAGFIYRNVDLLQTLPGVAGMATYLINTLLLHSTEKEWRREKKIYLPPGWRLGLNESAKVLSTLGLNNVFRALRYRWAESVDEKRESAEVLATQRETLEKAQAEIKALTERIKQLQSGGK